MEKEEKLTALYLYFSALEKEIDRKLYRVKRETRRLHTIYDSIRPREYLSKKEPRDEYEVLKVICESRHQKMPEINEAPKELTQFEVFQQEVEKFRNSPAMKREQFSADFVSKLRKLTKPSTAQVQERIDENTKLLKQQLLNIAKLDLTKQNNAYLFKETYESAEKLINKYKEICKKYDVTEVVDSVFKEQKYSRSDDEPKKQSEVKFASFSSKFPNPLQHKQIFDLRNDARMSLVTSRIQKRAREALIPFIDKDPDSKRESKPTFIAAKTAVNIFSDQSRQWLTIYQ